MSSQQIELPEGPVKIKRPAVKTDISKVIKALEVIASAA